MKLKKPFVLAMSLCMAFGIGMTAAACDTEDTPGGNVTYTVNINVAEASVLDDVKVLFYSDDAQKSVTLNGSSASAELPEGDYLVYLTGQIPGYTYTPVKVGKTQLNATISVEEVEANESGNVPFEFLVVYPGSEKIFKGSDENRNSVQICTSEGQEGIPEGCYDHWFDANYIAHLSSWGEPLYVPAGSYDVHFLDSNWPEGYTFDETRYTVTAAGGFYTIELQAL